MNDQELRRILRELDSALEVIRKHRGHDFKSVDAEIQVGIAEIRRELAVYRALLQTRTESRR